MPVGGRKDAEKKPKKKYIPYSSFLTYLNGGPGKNKTESLDGHGFLWENGVILCMTCNGKSISEPRRMKRHITFQTHKNNLKAKKGNESKRIITLQQLKSTKDNTQRQYTITPEVQAYRCEALKEVAKANISLSSFTNMCPWIDRHSKSDLSLGDAQDLPRAHP